MPRLGQWILKKGVSFRQYHNSGLYSLGMLRIRWVGNSRLEQGPISVVLNHLNILGLWWIVDTAFGAQVSGAILATRTVEQLTKSCNVHLRHKCSAQHETSWNKLCFINPTTRKLDQVLAPDPSNPTCPITHVFSTSIQIMFRRNPLTFHTFSPTMGPKTKTNCRFGASLLSFAKSSKRFRSYRSPTSPPPAAVAFEKKFFMHPCRDGSKS